ncbi:hypothetical protein C8A00DRAFT_33738 [Chaetomidium leptoderma]|uniref:Uncharacterized protein n=1 Tax=Chaetomidium leptoderma TaxID=669021 RepID=A0AAN6VNE6_9PEZI|nr:hypothetical protein C8A00DRAFT_33738 [Chaetomidium leptoderma]
MRSAIQFLAQHLDLKTPEVAGYLISRFSEYVLNFLHDHPNVLDPDFAQIRARVHLTMAHRPVGWLWTQHNTPAAMRLWGQEEHATALVLRVLDYLANEGHCPKDCGIDQMAFEIHRCLCVLQSLWLQNGVWVGDRQLEMELGRALGIAMEELELVRAVSVNF